MMRDCRHAHPSESTNTRAVAALLDRRPGRDPLVQRRVARIVDRVRRDGDRALLGVRADSSTGSTAPIEVTPRRDRAERRGSVRPDGPAGDSRWPPATSGASRGSQIPRRWTMSPVAGRLDRTACRCRSIASGCYVPGGRYPLPSSLLMTAIPARVAGVPEVIAVCPRPDATVMARRSKPA